MMNELLIGFCPVCGDTMFDICVTCRSYLKKDNCMQVTVELGVNGKNVIPFCSKHIKDMNVDMAQKIYDLGIRYNIKNGLGVGGAGAKVTKVLKNTLQKQNTI